MKLEFSVQPQPELDIWWRHPKFRHGAKPKGPATQGHFSVLCYAGKNQATTLAWLWSVCKKNASYIHISGGKQRTPSLPCQICMETTNTTIRSPWKLSRRGCYLEEVEESENLTPIRVERVNVVKRVEIDESVSINLVMKLNLTIKIQFMWTKYRLFTLSDIWEDFAAV